MKVFTVILSLFSLIIFDACTTSKNQQVTTTSLRNDARKIEQDKVLIKWMEHKIDTVMVQNNIPAISVGIIKNGKVILSKGFGVHKRDGDKKATETSIYQIASDTKKMTGMIAKYLVNDGVLNLDTPIIDYLGNTLEKKAQERLKGITMRLLLIHKSGLPYRQVTIRRKGNEPMKIPYSEKDIINDLNKVELKSEPNTKFGYSNFGYAVAGYICEQASGKKYVELVEQYISKNYEMPNTTTVLTEQQQKNLVTPYMKEDRNQETQAFVMGKLAAAGGVFSNINDLTNLMLRQINAYTTYEPNTQSFNPLILHDKPNVKEDGYGFGMGKKVFDTGIQFGHGGDMDGFASGYVFSPNYKSGIILLTSSGGHWVGELEKELFYKLTNRKYTPPKKSIAEEVYNIILSKGYKEGEKWLKAYQNSNQYYLKEEEMNNVGYALLQQQRNDDALSVFKLNVELFPTSANVYDSLGETYLKEGNKELAIQNYKKSLELNPKNENAIKVLKQLEDR